MIGLFSVFGRSQEQQRLDVALRQAGLHPKLVPDAVKIAALKQMKEACSRTVDDAGHRAAAQLLSYCMLGPVEFADIHDTVLTHATQDRLEAALKAGDTLDARLVLLCLYAELLCAEVRDTYHMAGE